MVGIFALVMAVLLSTACFFTAKVAFADEGLSEFSLYQRASEVARNFGTALAPGGTAVAPGAEEGVKKDVKYMMMDGDSYIKAGNAGGFIGYAEFLKDDKGIKGWLTSSFTSSSMTITYDQIRNLVPDVESSSDNPFYVYAGYGDALTQMGLAKTVRAGSIGNAMRFFTTGLTLLVYLLANVAPFVFYAALLLLDWFNPFKLFMGAINGLGKTNIGILQGVADYVGEVYTAIQNLSMYVILPMMLVLTVLSVLMFKNGQTSALKKFSRYALRVFMIFAGLPLIGATYTTLIGDLEEQVSRGSDYANYLVLSSYVDFEGWVKNTRLAIPEEVETQIKHPGISDEKSVETMRVAKRDLILTINAQGANNAVAQRLQERYANKELSEVFKDGSEQFSENDYIDSLLTTNRLRNVIDLLMTHMTSATYSGAEYDGEVAGKIQQYLAKNNMTDNIEEDIVRMYSLTSSDSRSLNYGKWKGRIKTVDWTDESVKGFFGDKGGSGDFKFNELVYNIYNAGNLTYVYDEESKSGHFEARPEGTSLQPVGKKSEKSDVVGGLSPLAMYNFLNTTFTESGLKVYSPQKSTSDVTRDAYSSVAFGSSGVVGFMRWVENIVVMLCLSVLSIGFGIIIITTAIKSIPRILTSIFGTAFGSVTFITKLLIVTAVLICEIVGFIFLYALAEDATVSVIVNMDSLTSELTGYFNSSGTLVDFGRSLIVVLITVILTIFMIRNAKIFRDLIEEGVSNIINKFMNDTDKALGGEGVNIGKSTGGRFNPNTNRLNDAYKAPKPPSLANLMGQANAIEKEREENGEGAEDTGLGGMSRKGINRAKTAMGLAAASMKDSALGLASPIDGKESGNNYYNEALKDAEEDAMMNPYVKPVSRKELSSDGQRLDENGDILLTEQGDALDREGRAISSDSGAAIDTHPVNGRPELRTFGDGAIMNRQGERFVDEEGNALYQDKEGHLTDENGNFVMVDKDGVARPSKESRMAVDEARKLNQMRHKSNRFQEMRNEQKQRKTGAYNPNKQSPKNGSNGSQRKKATVAGAYMTLAKQGVTNYGQYKQQVKSAKQHVKSSRSQLKQAQQKLDAYKKQGRSPREIAKAKQEIQQAKVNYNQAQHRVQSLRDNAHGLLRTERFEPPVASRPLRQDSGQVYVNKMSKLSARQKAYEKLVQKGKLSEAQRQQMTKLQTEIGTIRQDLVSKGIRADMLKDSSTTQSATKILNQEWTKFVDGDA